MTQYMSPASFLLINMSLQGEKVGCNIENKNKSNFSFPSAPISHFELKNMEGLPDLSKTFLV